MERRKGADMTVRRFCDGIGRRDVLRVGAAGLFGLGLTLPRLLELQARAAAQGARTSDVSLIFLFLHGGLSTIDTFDLKPDAAAEFQIGRASCRGSEEMSGGDDR